MISATEVSPVALPLSAFADGVHRPLSRYAIEDFLVLSVTSTAS